MTHFLEELNLERSIYLTGWGRAFMRKRKEIKINESGKQNKEDKSAGAHYSGGPYLQGHFICIWKAPKHMQQKRGKL